MFCLYMIAIHKLVTKLSLLTKESYNIDRKEIV